ncbi:MAG: radical SAM protein [Elusimicrobiota bacterium]
MNSISAQATPFNSLFNKTYRSRIPVACTLELTKNCNLRCRHCYLDFRKKSVGELSTAQVKKILNQLAAAGALYLVFTGGEIFLRKDIFELCEYARRLKFSLRIFTNGTLITENTARKISETGVSAVEISLYGRKNTHESITRAKGSFEKTMRAVKLLAKFNVPVVIKCPIITMNICDYAWLKSTANKLKVKLQLDPIIAPKNNGNKSVLKYRLSPVNLRKILKKELPPEKIVESKNTDLLCSAGRNLVAVNSSGMVYPCLQLLIPLGNIKKSDFNTIWSMKNKAVSGLMGVKPKMLLACGKCKLVSYCQRCPGLAFLEDKSLLGPNKIACKIAEIRKNLSF